MRIVTLMRSFLFVFSLAALSLSLPSCNSDGGGAATRIYELGTKAQVGTLGYTVFERQWLNQLGEPGSAEARVPQNRFLLLRLAVLNAGGATASMPNVKLLDDKGKTWEELSNGDSVVQWIGSVRQIKAADTIQGNVLFDVPPQHYKIVVTDEDGKETAYVDLPLTFDSTTTEVPAVPEKR